MQLYTLSTAPLTWLVQPAVDPSGNALPEIMLLQSTESGDTLTWNWFRWLLDAGQFDAAFTIDAARFALLGRNSDNSLQLDYAGDGGDTIRFGDGTFGLVPDDGAQFAATYRVGAGAAGNVAAGAITQLIRRGYRRRSGIGHQSAGGSRRRRCRSLWLGWLVLRRRHFTARRSAPSFPKTIRRRRKLCHGCSGPAPAFRWTGSWLTVFTTPDPLGSEQVTVPERTELIDLLNRYRMAGYESYVPDPQYASIDLLIDVCAEPTAFRGDVMSAITATLSPAGPLGGPPGFFAPDHFSFGQPLQRSALEAAIQRVVGVDGVLCIRYRLRNRMSTFSEMPSAVTVAVNQIVRCDNDFSRAEHGSFRVAVEGGR